MRISMRFPLLVMALYVAPVAALGQGTAPASQDPPARLAREAAIDQAVAREMQRQELVGVAIGVIQDGQIAYLKGYGLADRESGKRVTDQTVFNWASNSKPMAAVLAMQLVEQGKLDLDKDIRDYVPEFPKTPQVITARRLLCHQSGIPHYANGRVISSPGPAAKPGTVPDPVTSLHRFDRSPLLFDPGAKYSYSSYAYVLLSAVVERAGGQPFDTQLRERIAKPAQLESLQLDEDSRGHDDWAKGYTKTRTNRIVPAPEEAHAWKLGAGGYKSNIKDFARWAKGLIDHKFVSQASEQRMWTRQRLNSGDETTMGLGFMLESDETLGPNVSHGGSQQETKTVMMIFPSRGIGVVVMCNCNYADASAVASAVLKALEPAE